MTLSDFVVVMNRGLVEQYGTPQQLYHAPQTRFVAGFMGSPSMNFLDAKLLPARGGTGLELAVNEHFSLPVPADRTERYAAYLGKPVTLGLRPEHITETRGDAGAQAAEVTVPIDVVEPMGMETLVFFHVGQTEVCARVEPSMAVAPDELMRLRANLAHLHVIDPLTDKVIQ